MRKYFSFFLLIFIAFFLFACQAKQTTLTHKIKPNCEYYSLKSAECMNISQMIKELEPYKVIFIGDHHTEDNLHKNIAYLISALSSSGVKVHLANEWFYPRDQKILNAFTSKDINETEFIKQIEWKQRLKYYKYDSFKPMYETIKSTQGRLHGINLSKKERKKISDQNLSVMSKQELLFNNTLDTNVSAHKDLVLPYLSHCHAPKKNESLEECVQRMYRVQVAWDTKMALESHRLSQTLQENEKLLVFTGSMHIENKLGIPLRFSRLTNKPFVSIIPADKKSKKIKHGLGDFLLLY